MIVKESPGEKIFIGFTVNETKSKQVNFEYIEFIMETFKKEYTEILSYTVSKSDIKGRWNIIVTYK